MKKIILIIVAILVIVVVGCCLNTNNTNDNFENLEDLDGKIVLYFKNINTGEIDKEYRNVSMKKIRDNMPKTIVEEVLIGTTVENLVSTIPSRN